MRVEFTIEATAQAFADEIHQRMIAADPEYSRSVKAGQTLRWAIPYRDLDENGIPRGNWWVNLKDRTDKVLTSSERLTIKSYSR